MKARALLVMALVLSSASLIFSAIPAHATGPIVQTQIAACPTGCRTPTPSDTFASNVAAGDTIVVDCQSYNAQNDVFSSVTDSQMNHYTTVGNVNQDGSGFPANNAVIAAQAYATASASGPLTYQCNFTGAGNPFVSIQGLELTSTSAFLNSATGGGPLGSSPSTTSTSNSYSSGDVLIASAAYQGSCNAGASAGWGGLLGGAVQFDTVTLQPVASGSTNYPVTQGNICGITQNFALVGGHYGVAPPTCSITNADAGNYLLPSGKFYDFNCVAMSDSFSGSATYITDMKVKFNDSFTTVIAEYVNGSGSTPSQFILDAGSAIATLANSGTVTSSYNSMAQVRTLTVNFMISFSTNVADSSNRGIYVFAENALSATLGYDYLGNSFNFLYKGGAVSILSAGTCSVPVAADTFQTQCHYGSNAHNWIAENATYANLQQYQSQFALQMTNQSNGALVSYYWQPYWQSGAGTNPSSNKGDWTYQMGLYYYDNVTWVRGINFKLSMFNGRVGSSNLWTGFTVLWYNAKTLIANQTFYAFVPSDSGPNAVNLWVNLWYSQNNASTTEGGEVGAYYTGMHSQSYLLWSTWSPFLGNLTQSQAFVPLLDHSSIVMPSQRAGFTKVFSNMTRAGAPLVNAKQYNFQIATTGFTEQEFNTASAGMTGITTPSFTVAIIPTISSSSIFSPIINAIKSIATFFGKTLEAIGAAVWASLGSQFPWFTSTLSAFAGTIYSFDAFLAYALIYAADAVRFLYSIVSLVVYPITIIVNAYQYLGSSYDTVFGGVSLTAMTEVAVIFFFTSWFFATMESKSPVEGLVKMASLAWRVTYGVFSVVWMIAKFLVDTIEGLIP